MGIALLLTYEFISSFNVALQLTLSILLGSGIYFGIWMLYSGGYKKVIEFASYPLSALKRNKELN